MGRWFLRKGDGRNGGDRWSEFSGWGWVKNLRLAIRELAHRLVFLMDTRATYISEGRLDIRRRGGGSGWGRKWIKGLAVAVFLVRSVSAGVILPAVTSSQLDAGLKGEVLIEELNCVACHAGEASVAMGSKKAPRLGDVGSRVNPSYLEQWIGDPERMKPGTTMPDVLGNLGVEEKKRVAQSITHFLGSLKENHFSLLAVDRVAAVEGRRLFHSRGCAACHSPRDERGEELLPKSSVPLGALEKKYSWKSLTEFLRQPHQSRPSGRMPDLRLQGQDVDRIAHYLLQETRVPGGLGYTIYRGSVWEGVGSEQVKAERAGLVKDFELESLGKIGHHTAIRYEGWMKIDRGGRYGFFLKMNGGSLVVDGKRLIEQEPSDRRGVKDLEGSIDLAVGWKRVELTYFHTGHDPKFSCAMEGPGMVRGAILGSMLSVSEEKILAFEPLKVDGELAARGRENFGKYGCANCHDDVKVKANVGMAMDKLNPLRGCLSGEVGGWPRYDLSEGQRGLIAKALPTAGKRQMDDGQRIAKTLVTLNCIACHERAGLGGVAAERNGLFTGTQPALGDQGRIPPPLTGVGAKLTPEWMREVLLHGKRQREYVEASMPQFGEANVGHLVELFGKVDRLEAVAIPQVENLKESKAAGYEMVGTKGLSCIVCHEFNGQKSGEVAALDIARVTERLQKNWFNLYMREPSRFHPTVIMPSYWPNGQSTRPKILGGDTAQQIEALWAYLGDGSGARKPVGLSRQSSELRVGDVAEICRGRSPAGYRGIGVGYPERISLAFDSEEMVLRQMWKGDFASAEMGSFHPRGTETILFPRGIPFHRLDSLEGSWPYKGKTNYPFPQDHGYQFRGYRLDAKRRPTFVYLYGEIGVEDFFEDLRDKEGKAYFKRTLTFDAHGKTEPFYFRVATGKKISKRSAGQFGADALEVRIFGGHQGVVREGELGEVLIPLTLPEGRSTLIIEYQW